MRLLVRLRADRDAAYNSEYHHKLRGVIWNALSDTDYASLHGNRENVSFSYSNPFPVKPISAGDERHVIIASPHDGLIETLYEKFDEGTPFNIGEMPFTVTDRTPLDVDVGEPGDSGILRTDTGVYVRLPEERWDDYGIDPEPNAEEIGWTPSHSLGLFLKRIRENLAWKHDTVHADYLNNVNAETELFHDVNHQKTYSVDIPVGSEPSYDYTFVVSKWDFKYTVRNDDHRRWLNLLLDSGLGWRNSLGFGFINKEEQK